MGCGCETSGSLDIVSDSGESDDWGIVMRREENQVDDCGQGLGSWGNVHEDGSSEEQEGISSLDANDVISGNPFPVCLATPGLRNSQATDVGRYGEDADHIGGTFEEVLAGGAFFEQELPESFRAEAQHSDSPDRHITPIQWARNQRSSMFPSYSGQSPRQVQGDRAEPCGSPVAAALQTTGPVATPAAVMSQAGSQNHILFPIPQPQGSSIASRSSKQSSEAVDMEEEALLDGEYDNLDGSCTTEEEEEVDGSTASGSELVNDQQMDEMMLEEEEQEEEAEEVDPELRLAALKEQLGEMQGLFLATEAERAALLAANQHLQGSEAEKARLLTELSKIALEEQMSGSPSSRRSSSNKQPKTAAAAVAPSSSRSPRLGGSGSSASSSCASLSCAVAAAEPAAPTGDGSGGSSIGLSFGLQEISVAPGYEAIDPLVHAGADPTATSATVRPLPQLLWSPAQAIYQDTCEHKQQQEAGGSSTAGARRQAGGARGAQASVRNASREQEQQQKRAAADAQRQQKQQKQAAKRAADAAQRKQKQEQKQQQRRAAAAEKQERVEQSRVLMGARQRARAENGTSERGWYFFGEVCFSILSIFCLLWMCYKATPEARSQQQNVAASPAVPSHLPPDAMQALGRAPRLIPQAQDATLEVPITSPGHSMEFQGSAFVYIEPPAGVARSNGRGDDLRTTMPTRDLPDRGSEATAPDLCVPDLGYLRSLTEYLSSYGTRASKLAASVDNVRTYLNMVVDPRMTNLEHLLDPLLSEPLESRSSEPACIAPTVKNGLPPTWDRTRRLLLSAPRGLAKGGVDISSRSGSGSGSDGCGNGNCSHPHQSGRSGAGSTDCSHQHSVSKARRELLDALTDALVLSAAEPSVVPSSLMKGHAPSMHPMFHHRAEVVTPPSIARAAVPDMASYSFQASSGHATAAAAAAAAAVHPQPSASSPASAGVASSQGSAMGDVIRVELVPASDAATANAQPTVAKLVHQTKAANIVASTAAPAAAAAPTAAASPSATAAAAASPSVTAAAATNPVAAPAADSEAAPKRTEKELWRQLKRSQNECSWKYHEQRRAYSDAITIRLFPLSRAAKADQWNELRREKEACLHAAGKVYEAAKRQLVQEKAAAKAEAALAKRSGGVKVKAAEASPITDGAVKGKPAAADSAAAADATKTGSGAQTQKSEGACEFDMASAETGCMRDPVVDAPIIPDLGVQSAVIQEPIDPVDPPRAMPVSHEYKPLEGSYNCTTDSRLRNAARGFSASVSTLEHDTNLLLTSLDLILPEWHDLASHALQAEEQAALMVTSTRGVGSSIALPGCPSWWAAMRTSAMVKDGVEDVVKALVLARRSVEADLWLFNSASEGAQPSGGSHLHQP